MECSSVAEINCTQMKRGGKKNAIKRQKISHRPSSPTSPFVGGRKERIAKGEEGLGPLHYYRGVAKEEEGLRMRLVLYTVKPRLSEQLCSQNSVLCSDK